MRRKNDDSFYNIWPAYTDVLLGIFISLILGFSLLVIENNLHVLKLSKRPDTNMSIKEINELKKLRKFRELIKNINENLIKAFQNEKNIIRDPKTGAFIIKDSVFFDLAKDNLKPDGKIVLKSVGDKLKYILDKYTKNTDRNKINILVEGHTDSRGKERDNWELGAKRAISVVEYLKKQSKLDPKLYNVLPVSRAYFDPIQINAKTEEEHSKNRRIEIKIIIPLSLNFEI